MSQTQRLDMQIRYWIWQSERMTARAAEEEVSRWRHAKSSRLLPEEVHVRPLHDTRSHREN